MTLVPGYTGSARHRTGWVEAGPPDGPLMIFVHGWPELGVAVDGGHEPMLKRPEQVNAALAQWLESVTR
jgi:pimeloyl-ACP methyl ester carboxylesterase